MASYQLAPLVKRPAVKTNARRLTTNSLGARNEGMSRASQAGRSFELTDLPLNSYVAALELRIEKLDRRLEYAKRRKASVAQYEVDGATNATMTEAERRDSLAAIRAAIHRKAARNRENSDVNSLVSDFGIL